MSFFYANSGKTAIDENGVTGEANKGKEVAEYKLHKNPEGKNGGCQYRMAQAEQHLYLLLWL